MKVVIVCGTDTEIGKSYIANLIIRRYTTAQCVTASYKPVQTGNDGFSEDLLIHQQASRLESDARYDYYFVGNSRMSSYIFKTPVSPHLAAKIEKSKITIDKIYDDFQQFLRARYDLSDASHGIATSYVKLNVLVVELAGGILSPVNDIYTNLDIIKLFRNYCLEHDIEFELDLVAGSKLGSISQILAAVQLLPQLDHLIYNYHTLQSQEIVDHTRKQQEQLAKLIQLSNYQYLIDLQQYIRDKLLVETCLEQVHINTKVQQAYDRIKQYEIDNKLSIVPIMLNCNNFKNARILACDYQASSLVDYQVSYPNNIS